MKISRKFLGKIAMLPLIVVVIGMVSLFISIIPIRDIIIGSGLVIVTLIFLGLFVWGLEKQEENVEDEQNGLKERE